MSDGSSSLSESSDRELLNVAGRHDAKRSHRTVTILVAGIVGVSCLWLLFRMPLWAKLEPRMTSKAKDDTIALFGKSAERLKVEFYGQAGCSHCFEFMNGALNKTLNDSSLVERLDFEYFPFGNAYFVTSMCQGDGGYDMEARKCYDKECGKSATSRPDDCFGPGQLICQNGEDECDANRYAACAKNLTGNDFKHYLPFVGCIDKSFMSGAFSTVAASGCAAHAGLNFDKLQSCFLGAHGDDAIKAMAMATPAHTFCPVVVVGGEMLEWGTENGLLAIVCSKLVDSAKLAACSGDAQRLRQ